MPSNSLSESLAGIAAVAAATAKQRLAATTMEESAQEESAQGGREVYMCTLAGEMGMWGLGRCTDGWMVGAGGGLVCPGCGAAMDPGCLAMFVGNDIVLLRCHNMYQIILPYIMMPIQ